MKHFRIITYMHGTDSYLAGNITDKSEILQECAKKIGLVNKKVYYEYTEFL